MNTVAAIGNFTPKVTNEDTTLTPNKVAFKSSTSQACADEILMDRYIFGIEKAIKHFGISPSKHELAYLTDVPFSEETLKACRHTHILTAVFPLSILDIYRKVDHLFSSTHFEIIKSWDVYHEDILLKEQEFAKDHGTIGWHLVRKDAAPNSVNLSWQSQSALLGINNKVPSARVLIYTIVGFYLSTGGDSLFTSLPHLRCSDHLYLDHGVVVSNWRKGDLLGVASGIGCGNYSRSFSDERLGVASERRS